jgi:hypothetical protein
MLYHYISLLVASSHNFISPHFYIKYLNMPNNIPVINQEDFEPKLLPNLKLTMTMLALQYLAPLSVPQFPENNFNLKQSASNDPMGKSCYTCP